MTIFTILSKNLNEKFYNNNISLHLLLLCFDKPMSDLITEKWGTYRESIVENNFLTGEDRRKAIAIFTAIQKLRFAAIRLSHMWKLKHVRKYDVDTDLNLTPLSSYEEDDKILLIEDNRLYEFTLLDLNKIVNNGLFNSEYMDVTVTHPRNPYTNKPFSKHNIYNIILALMFHARGCNLKAHIISYFQCNLDLEKFYEYNQILLKQKAVDSYIETSDTSSLFQYVCEMFEDYRDCTTITIDSGLRDKKIIIEKVSHLLSVYLFLQQINTNDNLYYKYNRKLSVMLKEFTANNPKFGRIILVRNGNSSFLRRDVSTVTQQTRGSLFSNTSLLNSNTMLSNTIFNRSIRTIGTGSHNNSPFFRTNPFMTSSTVPQVNISPTSTEVVTSLLGLTSSPPTIQPPSLEVPQQCPSDLFNISSESSLPSLEEWVDNAIQNTQHDEEQKEEEDDDGDGDDDGDDGDEDDNGDGGDEDDNGDDVATQCSIQTSINLSMPDSDDGSDSDSDSDISMGLSSSEEISNSDSIQESTTDISQNITDISQNEAIHISNNIDISTNVIENGVADEWEDVEASSTSSVSSTSATVQTD